MPLPFIGAAALGGLATAGRWALGALTGTAIGKVVVFGAVASLGLMFVELEEIAWGTLETIVNGFAGLAGSDFDVTDPTSGWNNSQAVNWFRWITYVTGFWESLTIVSAAWVTAFLIRRIPFIG